MFPCFDDPELKARFVISVVVDDEFSCMSNMPEVTRDATSSGTSLYTFAESPPMSTYVCYKRLRSPDISRYVRLMILNQLVAIVVGKFDHLQLNTAQSKVTVYTPRGQAEDGNFALHFASRCLEFYETLFGMSYTLPKLDLVAIPDFACGAMENWGLVLFQPHKLLLKWSEASLDRQRVVSDCIFHELAHQWLGNLVTITSWDELWLKEGLATWISAYAMNHFQPNWHVWSFFILDAREQAMEIDSLHATHPLYTGNQDPTDYGQSFDQISYRKGACIIHMIYSLLGDSRFFTGIRCYIESYKFSNASADEVWLVLQTVGTIPIPWMRGWVETMGFPLVTVEDFSGGDSKGQRLFHLRMCRHYELQDDIRDACRATLKFPIRLSIRTESAKTELNFDSSDAVVSLAESRYHLFNAGYSGYFRTKYREHGIMALVRAAQVGDIDDTETAGLLADTVALCRSGHVKTSVLLGLVSQLCEDARPPITLHLLKHLVDFRVSHLFQRPEIVNAVEAFCLAQIRHWTERRDFFTLGGACVIKDDEVSKVLDFMIVLGDHGSGKFYPLTVEV